MAEFINPLDFRKIFVQYFLGTQELFVFAFVIVFAFAAAKMGMTNKIFIILLGVGSLIFSLVLGEAIYMLVILFVGIITFKGVARLVSG